MKRALLLVAHGSRREAANDEARQLTVAVRAVAGDRFHAVACAFLELAEPSIHDGIEALVAAGAEQVVVLPYFLAAGRHVSEDLPAAVATKQAEHPHVEILLAPYLGTAGEIPALLCALAESVARK